MLIDGLTKHQIQLLTKMWSMNTLDEIREWQWGLSDYDKMMVDSLIELAALDYIDELVDAYENYNSIQSMLTEIFKR